MPWEEEEDAASSYHLLLTGGGDGNLTFQAIKSDENQLKATPRMMLPASVRAKGIKSYIIRRNKPPQPLEARFNTGY